MAKLVIGTDKTTGVVVRGTGRGSTKYGVSIDVLIGNVNSNGVLQRPSGGSIILSGITDVGNSAFSGTFYDKTITSFSAPGLTTVSGKSAFVNAFYLSTIGSVSFDDLETISGDNAFEYAFRYAKVTNFAMPKLRVISGSYTFQNAFAQQSGSTGSLALTSVDLSSLEEITNTAGFAYAFIRCANLTSVSLPKLTKVTGSIAMSQTFRGTGITTLTLGGTSPITFSSYKDIFKNMFQECSQNITVNAPAGNQTDIEAMDGYPNFGGTGTVTWNWVS